MKCGDIWLVIFSDSLGHEYQKNRPALIIESNEQLKMTSVVTIVPLTTKDKRHKDDIVIAKNNKNNLLYDSIIKVHHIQSFDKTRFLNKLGEADKEVLETVKKYLKKHFDL